MSGVNETRLLVQHELFKCKGVFNEVHIFRSENGILMNVGVNVKNYMIEVLLKMILSGILVRAIVNIMRHAKLTKI